VVLAITIEFEAGAAFTADAYCGVYMAVYAILRAVCGYIVRYIKRPGLHAFGVEGEVPVLIEFGWQYIMVAGY
jgi:hypothetical protein